jgi:hypothetical protein
MVVLNHPAMREFDYYKRILDERWLHLLPASISLDSAKSATENYLSLPVSQRFIDPRIIFARDSRRIVDIYAKMPCFSRDFLGNQVDSLEPHYDLIATICGDYAIDSMMQLGASDLGATLIAAIAGNPAMKQVDWSGEYQKTRQNINRFYEYYFNVNHPQTRYLLQGTASGHQMIVVGGENDYQSRKRNLDHALKSDADLVLMTDYFTHSKARSAARDCSKDHNRLLRLVHTDRGIALWDKTPTQRFGRDLDKKGITQLLH